MKSKKSKNSDNPELTKRVMQWLQHASKNGKQPPDSCELVKAGAPWNVIKDLQGLLLTYLGINGQLKCRICDQNKDQDMVECSGCNKNFHRSCLENESGRKRARVEVDSEGGHSAENADDGEDRDTAETVCPNCAKPNFLEDAVLVSAGHRCTINPISVIVAKLHASDEMSTSTLLKCMQDESRKVNKMCIEMHRFQQHHYGTDASIYVTDFIVQNAEIVCTTIIQAIQRVYRTTCMIKDQATVASHMDQGIWTTNFATGMSADFYEVPVVNMCVTSNKHMRVTQLLEQFFFTYGVAFDKSTEQFYAKNKGLSYFPVGKLSTQEFIYKARNFDPKLNSLLEAKSNGIAQNVLNTLTSTPSKQLPRVKFISWYVVIIADGKDGKQFQQGAVFPPCLVDAGSSRMRSSPEPFVGPPSVAVKYVRKILSDMDKYSTADGIGTCDETMVVAPVNLIGQPDFSNPLFDASELPPKISYKPIECDLLLDGEIVDPPIWRYKSDGNVQVKKEGGLWLDIQVSPPGGEGDYKLRPRIVTPLFEGIDFDTPTDFLKEYNWDWDSTQVNGVMKQHFATMIGCEIYHERDQSNREKERVRLMKLVGLYRMQDGEVISVDDRWWYPYHPDKEDEVMQSHVERMDFALMKRVNRICVWDKESMEFIDVKVKDVESDADEDANVAILQEGMYCLRAKDQMDHQNINPLFLPAKVLTDQLDITESLVAMSFVGDRIYTLRSDPNRFCVSFVGQSGTGKSTLATVVRTMQGNPRVGELVTSQKGQFNLEQLFKGRTTIIGEDLQPMQKDSSIGPKEFQSIISGEDQRGQVKGVQDHADLHSNIRVMTTQNYSMLHIWPKNTSGAVAAAAAVGRRFFQIYFSTLRNDRDPSVSQDILKTHIGSIILVLHWCYRVRLFAQRETKDVSQEGFKINSLEPDKQKPEWVPRTMTYKESMFDSPLGLLLFDQADSMFTIVGVTNPRDWDGPDHRVEHTNFAAGDCSDEHKVSLKHIMKGPPGRPFLGLNNRWNNHSRLKHLPKPQEADVWSLLKILKKERARAPLIEHFVLKPIHRQNISLQNKNTEEFLLCGVAWNNTEPDFGK